MATYKYHALSTTEPEIRLLKLLPGDRSSEVQIEFETIQLGSGPCPEYETLSYRWGQLDDLRHVRVGISGDKSIAVTQSVAAALPFLRYPDEPRVLWIDALCINQADVEEKNQQVPMMNRIYYSAVRVVVWLGQSENGSQLAFDVLNWLANPDDQSSNPTMATESRDQAVIPTEQLQTLSRVLEARKEVRLEQPTFTEIGLPDFNHHLWLALADIYSRPWFSRLWTVQEVLLAKDCVVLCEDRAIQWCHLLELGICLEETQLIFRQAYNQTPIDQSPGLISIGSDPSQPYTGFNILKTKPADKYSFHIYLLEGRRKGVLKPVDRIYALLGLADDDVRNAIVVDYSEKAQIEYWNLYIAVSKVIMAQQPMRMILSQVNSPSRVNQLPSWCPDYNSPPYRRARITGVRAGNALPKSFTPDPRDAYVIHVGGVGLDAIAETVGGENSYRWPQTRRERETIFGPKGAAADLLEILERQWDLARRTIPNEADAASAYWQTMLGRVKGQNGEEFPPDPEESLRFAKTRLRHLATSTAETFTPISGEAWDKVQSVRRRLGKLWQYRVFFSTTGGRLGFASKGARIGDKVCALFGEGDLYILRPKQSAEYEFISDGFVHGFMDGEGLHDLKDEEKSTFAIR